MPIEIDPTSSTASVLQPLLCDALYIEKLSIDGTARDAAAPSFAATITPYKLGTPNQYAAESWQLGSVNIYAASANIPQIGVAIEAVFAAMGAIHAYNVERQADLAAAQQALADAAADETAAGLALDNAVAARNQAYTDRSGETDPLWVNADAAWHSAQSALETAQAAVRAAQQNVKVATAALSDPANPRLAVSA